MNFNEESPSVPIPKEFLAVVLAGYGNELLPLTSDYKDEPCPKALLPVGNKPMISYTLAWLEESGVKDVLLICPNSHRTAISHHIHSDPASNSFSSLRIDIQTHDQSRESGTGTCNILRHFSSRIGGDFIVLPCDFVPPPSLHLSTVLDKFRLDSTSDGSILTSLWFEHEPPEKVKVVEDSWPETPTSAPMLYDEKTGTLLHVDTPDDADENADELELRMCVLWKYPRTKLTTKFMDSHVYVCKRVVLDLLTQKPHFESIKEEFIPWLCKIHTQQTKRQKYASVLSPITNNVSSSSRSLGIRHSTLYQPDTDLLHSSYEYDHISSSRAPSRASNPTTDMSSTAPPSPTMAQFKEPSAESLRCGIVVHRLPGGYAARANNIWSYQALNRAALVDLPSVTYDPALVDQKTNLSDSLIGDSTKIGERTVVKKSIVGRHCVIGKNVKINGSILLDHCTVEDNAKIEGCLVGTYTRIGSKAELLLCITPAGFEVESGGIYKHEKLDVSDWTTAPPAEDDSEDESQEEESDEEAE